jgi:fucose 4-O-acetylase-like acetyltransferase
MVDLQNRINWIDQAKGIGILLVVIGHMNIPVKLSVVIFSFHMPLFFFISGYLFNELKYKNNLKVLLISKLSSLVWPFITFTILAFLFLIIIGNFTDLKSFNWFEFLKGNKSINTPLWFLTALFATEIIFFQIVQASNSNIFAIVIIVLAILTLGFINIYTINKSLVLNIHIALISQSFFLTGWLFKKYNLPKIPSNSIYLLMISILSFSFLLITSLNNSRMDMIENKYGNILLVILSTFFGISFIIFMSKILLRLNYIKVVFDYMGKNSLPILGVHSIIAPFVVFLFGHFPFRLDRILIIIGIYISVEFFNRFIPIFLRLNLMKFKK